MTQAIDIKKEDTIFNGHVTYLSSPPDIRGT